jgi:hypothetical protein
MRNIFFKITIVIFATMLLHKNSNAQRGAAGSLFNGITAENSTDIVNGVIDAVIDVIPGVIDGANGAADSPPLSLDECVPDFSDNNNLQVSLCAELSACEECYATAREQMNFFRMQLGRANCIYQNTKKYTESKVAFGDGASGIHAMTALAWQRERQKINASFETFKGTYDRRYLEFITGLHTALLAFDACENQYGSGNWYAKVGFIYYDMMKERYKRTD